jgi:hypothetical protein
MKMHDLLHGHSAQQPHRLAALLARPPPRMCGPEPALLEGLPRLHPGDRLPAHPKQAPEDVMAIVNEYYIIIVLLK